MERMFGEVLVYLSNDACLYIGMKRAAQFGERPWRSYHDERILVGTNHLFDHCCDSTSEPVLLDLVPVGRLNSSPAACKRDFAQASRTIASLLVRSRIFVFKHLFGLEVGKFGVAMIPQDKCPAAVADQHQGVIGYFQHLSAPQHRRQQAIDRDSRDGRDLAFCSLHSAKQTIDMPEETFDRRQRLFHACSAWLPSMCGNLMRIKLLTDRTLQNAGSWTKEEFCSCKPAM
jgi:hypothetical protein